MIVGKVQRDAAGRVVRTGMDFPCLSRAATTRDAPPRRRAT